MIKLPGKALILQAFRLSSKLNGNTPVTIITSAGTFTGNISDFIQSVLGTAGEELSYQHVEDIEIGEDEFIELKDVTFNPGSDPSIEVHYESVAIFIDQVVGWVFEERPEC